MLHEMPHLGCGFGPKTYGPQTLKENFSPTCLFQIESQDFGFSSSVVMRAHEKGHWLGRGEGYIVLRLFHDLKYPIMGSYSYYLVG
jgi:hypothetical protein